MGNREVNWLLFPTAAPQQAFSVLEALHPRLEKQVMPPGQQVKRFSR